MTVWPLSVSRRVHEGEYCTFPSFGKGWFDEVIDGTRVSLGVKCSDGEVYDNGDHVIASRGSKCEFVCKAENGEQYRPRQMQMASDLQCLSPVPIEFYNSDGSGNCYENPWAAGTFVDQCMPEWLDQGVGLLDATITNFDTL